MECVLTVSYSILLNGKPLQLFKPKCGLRQGDPLSPFLFILCMEALSGMLTNLEEENKLKGLQVARGALVFLICSSQMTLPSFSTFLRIVVQLLKIF